MTAPGIHMRIAFFLWLIFFSLHLTSLAGSVERLYLFNEPVTRTDGDYSRIEFPGTSQFGEPGGPLLPFQPVMLLLPPGEEAVEFRIHYLDPVDLEGDYELHPAQAYRPYSSTDVFPFLKNENIYKEAGPYPQDIDNKVSTHFMNGHSLAVTTFTPVRYYPSEGRIRYFQKVRVVIQTGPSARAAAALKRTPHLEKFRARVARIAHNPEMIAAYQGNATDASNPPRDGGYQYLMLSIATFAPELDTLITFYQQRGIISRCYTLSYIDTAVSGQDMPEKIRNFIIEEYQNNGIEYVLLAGDTEVVPYRGFYCTVQSTYQYTDYSIPSDLYYSSLDGTWNDDNDGLWAEPGEDDLFPEVAVGRLTFSDTIELHNMIHKVVMYQQAPVVSDLDRPLLAGEHLYSNPITWGSDYLRLLVGNQAYNGYTTTGIPATDDIDTLYDRYSYWDKYRLMDSINNGHSFIHHVGHANSGYVMKLYKADITNANFSQVNGVDHTYPLIYTHGCICGAYDYNDCIAEKMIGIDNFAVAFIGNSRYGWFVEGTADGPSQHLHREFVDALYTDSLYRLGMAHMMSKIETAPFVDLPGEYEPGAHRWCFYDCNVLGDPMMAIWTGLPHSISVVSPPLVMAGADTVTVTVSYSNAAQKGMNCGFFQGDSLLGCGVSDSTGKCDIVFFDPPQIGEATLVVSGFNVLPHSFNTEVSDFWLGSTTDWSDPQNWHSGQVPDSTRNIIIPADPPGSNFPLTNSGRYRHCNAIFLEPGTVIHIGDAETVIIHNY